MVVIINAANARSSTKSKEQLYEECLDRHRLDTHSNIIESADHGQTETMSFIHSRGLPPGQGIAMAKSLQEELIGLGYRVISSLEGDEHTGYTTLKINW